NIRVTITQRKRPTVATARASGAVVIVIPGFSSRASVGLGGHRDAADVTQFAEGDASRLSGLYLVDAGSGAGGHILPCLQGIAALGRQAQQEGQGGRGTAGNRGGRAGADRDPVDEHLARRAAV